MSDSFQPSEPAAGFRQHRRNLPHRTQLGCTYFITWRMADSIPAPQLNAWIIERDAWLLAHPKPWDTPTTAAYEREFSRRLDRWLDEGHGSCALKQPAIRKWVVDALMYFEGQRYALDSFVVMPNHVHVLVKPLAGQQLADILQSWKGFTAREINRALGTSGKFWMDESFDHAVRNAEELERFRAYIRENPVKAALGQDEFSVWEKASVADESGRLESLRHSMAADLAEIGRTHMPFGKFGPAHFPPNGIRIFDLPAEYLMWFANKAGFPKGRLGQLLQMVCQMKADGSDSAFDVFRKRAGGKAPLRQPVKRSFDLNTTDPEIPF